MSIDRTNAVLNKFTTFNTAMKILKSKSIQLRDPSDWPDKNDVHCLNHYKKINSLKTILATCFVDGGERYHHWMTYTHEKNKNRGVCIEFDKSKLVLDIINAKKCIQKDFHNKIRFKNVIYKSTRELEFELLVDGILLKDELPFRKKIQYEDENEFRIIFESDDKIIDNIPIDINLESINKITYSYSTQEIEKLKFDKKIKNLNGCSHIKTNISQILKHEKWFKVINNIK